MVFRKIVNEKNTLLYSIIVFVIIYSYIQYTRPLFLFNTNGSIRKFGIGYKNKTIFPIWILTICLAIISYIIIMCLREYTI